MGLDVGRAVHDEHVVLVGAHHHQGQHGREHRQHQDCRGTEPGGGTHGRPVRQVARGTALPHGPEGEAQYCHDHQPGHRPQEAVDVQPRQARCHDQGGHDRHRADTTRGASRRHRREPQATVAHHHRGHGEGDQPEGQGSIARRSGQAGQVEHHRPCGQGPNHGIEHHVCAPGHAGAAARQRGARA